MAWQGNHPGVYMIENIGALYASCSLGIASRAMIICVPSIICPLLPQKE
jgi:hypothetical protein